MNSTHGNSLGLDQIHTEANQKHLFLEINLSLGNDFIYTSQGGSAHTYSHTYVLCITDRIHAQIPRQATLLLGREGDLLVSICNEKLFGETPQRWRGSL